MLKLREIEQINRTRRILREEASKGPVDYGDFEFGGGKYDEACEAAERALVNVLVIASAYMGVEISDLQFNGGGAK